MNTPKRYRKKPVVIEAAVWERHGDHPKVNYYRHPPVDPATGEVSASDDAILMGNLRHNEVPERFRRDSCHATMHDHGWIDTLEGGHTVCPGDFIIKGVQGEFYPCKPDIFTATYDPEGRRAMVNEWTRDDIDRALINVTSNAMNYPTPSQMLGKDTGPLRKKCVDAVCDLLGIEAEQATDLVECPDCGESMPKHWLYWHPFNCDTETTQEASDE